MANKTYMHAVTDTRYESIEGLVMAREYGKTPNGNDVGGRWVLRDSSGAFLDFDQYSNDLVERHNLKFH